MKVKLSAARASATLQACPLEVTGGSASMPRVALQASLSKGCFHLRRGQQGFTVRNILRTGPSLGWDLAAIV